MDWISVKDELPPDDIVGLLLLTDGSHVWLAYYEGQWDMYDDDYAEYLPTHWMPLPALPGEPEDTSTLLIGTHGV